MKEFKQTITFTKEISIKAESAQEANRKVDEIVEEIEFNSNVQFRDCAVWDDDDGEDFG